ncbi:MAG: TetR/AcrR family transcriptional regulator, transcriptional repressor for nem operon, partial [Ilumatobacteraceae bacterium]
MKLADGTVADTADRALDVAERLVQVRGFNGVSYADVAAELGITKAALHYHFASKAELGEALIIRYTERFQAALGAIDEDSEDAPSKISAYAGIYINV